MIEWLSTAYPWVKAAHIVAVVAWMAGLLYMPRLFVYHAEALPASETAQTLALMERRLLRGIMNPALGLTALFGAALAATPGVVDWHQGWIWMKLALVACLAVFHYLLAGWRRSFAMGAMCHRARFFRLVNEIPTVVLIAIVILVVVKPF